MTKTFNTYSAQEYRTNKSIRRTRTEAKKLQTERMDYEETNQESFFKTSKKVAR